MNVSHLRSSSIFHALFVLRGRQRAIDQLKQFGTTRRGWLGVSMQDVTDEVAERLGMKPSLGALVVGIDE